VCHTGGKWLNAPPITAKQDKDKAVLAVYIAAKDVYAALY